MSALGAAGHEIMATLIYLRRGSDRRVKYYPVPNDGSIMSYIEEVASGEMVGKSLYQIKAVAVEMKRAYLK